MATELSLVVIHLCPHLIKQWCHSCPRTKGSQKGARVRRSLRGAEGPRADGLTAFPSEMALPRQAGPGNRETGGHQPPQEGRSPQSSSRARWKLLLCVGPAVPLPLPPAVPGPCCCPAVPRASMAFLLPAEFAKFTSKQFLIAK